MEAKERVMKALRFEPLDRPPIIDIVHNIPVLEYYGGEKITPENAFDVTCRALSNACDLTRAVGIPDGLGEREVVDEQGFVYHFDWWTLSVKRRPFKTTSELAEIVKKDIDNIYKSMERNNITFRYLVRKR